jgi:hypothetical protein
LRHGKRSPASRRDDRAANVKRFAFYLSQRINGDADDIDRLANYWAMLTQHDVDLAKRLWEKGLKPGVPEEYETFLTEGYDLKDLERIVSGRTITEHLLEGNSIKWCMMAITFQSHSG